MTIPIHTDAKLNAQQDAVYRLLCFTGPMTDEGLVNAYQAIEKTRTVPLPKQTDSGIRTRRTELLAAGILAKSPVPALTRRGRTATVYEVIR